MARWTAGRGVWNPVSSAPADKKLEVQVGDGFGTYALKFPCRLTSAGWVNADTEKALVVQPIGWRPYQRSR